MRLSISDVSGKERTKNLQRAKREAERHRRGKGEGMWMEIKGREAFVDQ